MKTLRASPSGISPVTLTRHAPYVSLLAGLVLLLGATAVASGFAGGSGTAEDPFIVTNATHLDQVRDYPDAHFRQMANIDLGVAPWNQGTGWLPILGRFDPWSIDEGMDFVGGDVAAFLGTYDGNGHAILNLTINVGDDWDYGGYALFGLVAPDAVIKDLRLVNVSVNANSFYVAPLVAYNAGTVHGCYADGEVSGQIHYTSGLVGANVGLVSQSYSAVSVFGGMDFGGISGANWANGRIEDSYFIGTLAGDGIRGGGIVGWNEAAIIRCYMAGLVAASSYFDWEGELLFDIGYLVSDSGEGTVQASYWDAEINNVAPNLAPGGRETAAMMMASTYSGWDFISVWSINEHAAYPQLVQNHYHAPEAYDTIAIVIEPPDSGTASGAGLYPRGGQITLNAMPAEGMVFESWMVGDSLVSELPAYSFTVSGDLTLTAHFRELLSPVITSLTQEALPQSTSVLLQVTATHALTHQWYQGESGDTSAPIMHGVGNTLTVDPDTTTSYWVRVHSADNLHADSDTITVIRETNGGGEDPIDDFFGEDLYVYPGSTPGTDQWYFSFTFKNIFHFAGTNWFFFEVFDAHLWIKSTLGALDAGFWAYVMLENHATWAYTSREGNFGDLRDSNGDGIPDLDDSVAGDQSMAGYIYIHDSLPNDPVGPAWYFFGEFPSGNWIVNMDIPNPTPSQWHQVKGPAN